MIAILASTMMFLPAGNLPAAPSATSSNAISGVSGAPQGWVDGLWNPEDLVPLEGTSWILVSAMGAGRERGALFAVNKSQPAHAVEVEWAPGAAAGRLDRLRFDAHGIAARRRQDGRFDVLVVDHGGKQQAIDRLVLDVSRPRPTIVEGTRLMQPNDTSGNAVAFLPQGGFVMTGFFDPNDSSTADELASGRPTGQLWHWAAETGWRRLGPRLSGANGLVVSPDGKHLIVNEWAARRILRMSLDGRVERSVTVDFIPDNLRWLDARHLLVAGQDARAERIFTCGGPGAACPLGYVVATIDSQTLELHDVIRKSDDEAQREQFGAATGALMVGSELWVGSFTGERIARFSTSMREPQKDNLIRKTEL